MSALERIGKTVRQQLNPRDDLSSVESKLCDIELVLRSIDETLKQQPSAKQLRPLFADGIIAAGQTGQINFINLMSRVTSVDGFIANLGDDEFSYALRLSGDPNEFTARTPLMPQTSEPIGSGVWEIVIFAGATTPARWKVRAE